MSDQQLPSTDASTGSNKRKREMMDAGDGQRLTRSSHGQNSNGNLQGAYHPFDHGLPNTTELSQIDQQLLQHVGNQNGVSVSVADDNAMTAKAALAAHGSESKYPPPGPSFESKPEPLGGPYVWATMTVMLCAQGHGKGQWVGPLDCGPLSMRPGKAQKHQSKADRWDRAEWHTIRKE
ncbi:hypothetical protein PABG_05503 [Paracoccidioides brasiliensis Pb03]|nr:hypothetical protein PABG_05503 [Paracoccidioides brasiliensis Pb03]